MRIRGLTLIALGLLFQPAAAENGAAAQALIDQAIRAHGGEAALAKWPVVTVRADGIFHGYDRTPVFFFTSESTTHGPNRMRHTLDGRITVPNGKPNPQKFRIVNVLDGKQGWVKLAGEGKEDTQDYTPVQVADNQDSAYVEWIATYLPLKDRAFTLALAGEEKVLGKPAVGVRVSRPGRRDVTLFFDKETKLLVKTETRGKAGAGVEGRVETTLQSHKAVEGVQRPMHLMTSHDGRPLWSHWVLGYQLAEAPKDDTFLKP